MKPEVNMVGRLTRNVTNTFKNEDGSSERALFTLACNSYYNGKDGNGAKVKKESVDYVPCIAWAGLVPILTTWGLKGRLLHIRGVLDTFQAGPDDATGKYPPTKVQVKVVELQFLDKKPEGVETPKSSAPAAVESEHNITKIAEKVASLLLGAANASPQANTAQQANNANAQAEEAANAQAEEAANAQAAAGGDLGSVI
jgi:single-stranded DNA-binding protein